MILQSNVDYANQIFRARLGQDYGYGGSWSPTNLFALTDCSGLVGEELEALTKGTGMLWGHPVSTESWPYNYGTDTPAAPGTIGPYGTVAVASLADAPSDVAAIVAIHHGGGGVDSHTNICVAGTLMEDNGDHGVCTTGTGAILQTDPYWTDFWYLPGPIGTPLQGLDYAGGRPSAADIKAAGYDFVCRYLSDGGPGLPGKQLIASEVADLQANSVDIVSNWETTGTTALGGYQAGVADAQAASAAHTAVGGPDDRPIYFSIDWDEAPSQDAVVNAYFEGIASVIGLGRTGAYGAYFILQRLLDAGLITWAWQTQAWSGGNTDPRFHILQNNNAGYVTVDGVQCDLNQSQQVDFGQWNHQPTDWNDTMSPSPQDVLNNEQGVAPDGTPQWWNVVYGRHLATFGSLISNVQKGPWNEPYPNGITQLTDSTGAVLPPGGVWDHGAHDVLSAEQLAWRYADSAGDIVDLQSILMALWEYHLHSDPAGMQAAVTAAKVARSE